MLELADCDSTVFMNNYNIHNCDLQNLHKPTCEEQLCRRTFLQALVTNKYFFTLKFSTRANGGKYTTKGYLMTFQVMYTDNHPTTQT